mmetsp:Transcript_10666/g.29534  ORF Transcript_10666/g.29534 Transcript_10666/m.29534 type:complete len:215 (-) Transcript_10666:1540-2184(-)
MQSVGRNPPNLGGIIPEDRSQSHLSKGTARTVGRAAIQSKTRIERLLDAWDRILCGFGCTFTAKSAAPPFVWPTAPSDTTETTCSTMLPIVGKSNRKVGGNDTLNVFLSSATSSIEPSESSPACMSGVSAVSIARWASSRSPATRSSTAEFTLARSHVRGAILDVCIPTVFEAASIRSDSLPVSPKSWARRWPESATQTIRPEGDALRRISSII